MPPPLVDTVVKAATQKLHLFIQHTPEDLMTSDAMSRVRVGSAAVAQLQIGGLRRQLKCTIVTRREGCTLQCLKNIPYTWMGLFKFSRVQQPVCLLSVNAGNMFGWLQTGHPALDDANCPFDPFLILVH